jgi:hypothetical protein
MERRRDGEILSTLCLSVPSLPLSLYSSVSLSPTFHFFPCICASMDAVPPP